MSDRPQIPCRFQMWLRQSWPIRALTWLRFWGRPVPEQLGRFDDQKEVICFRADHPIFDPKNDHLFTIEAAMKAFEHVNVAGGDRNEIEPLTPETRSVTSRPDRQAGGTEKKNTL